MGSRWTVAWLLLLVLKAFGLKEGDPDVPMGLHCHQSIELNNVMNCSWHTRESSTANVTHIFYYQSLTYHPGQTHTVKAPSGQNWVIIERNNLTHGDKYRVWLEARSAAWTAASNELHFSLDEIVKPSPPHLHVVKSDSPEATVKWKNSEWPESQPLICALRYKTSKDHDWSYLSEDDVNQESHDFENLKPFTSYEVQARCIPENRRGFWSEWSISKNFNTSEAAPLGQVDVWRKAGDSENGKPSYLHWKALDPEAARGKILHYEVAFLDHSKHHVATVKCSCFSVPSVSGASYAWVSAHNSIKATVPANLSLEETDLPGPQEVRVLVVQGLGFNVTWKPNMSPLWVQPKEYVVEWTEEIPSGKEESLNWIRQPNSSNSVLVRGDFRPKIPYRVCVYALYAQGSSASVPVRAYFQEGVPSAGPQALQDRSISSTASVISWKKIPLANCNGHITNYTLYVEYPASRNPKAYGPIGATERSYNLLDLEPGTSYHVWMTGSTSAGEGVPSHQHHFHTPDSHWKLTLTVCLVVGSLIFLGLVVVLVKYTWFLSFCRKLLPPWCWEKIPDPGHSGVVFKIDEQTTVPAMDVLSSAKLPEELDIVEIKEPPPQQTTSPASVKISGYEKRFMPTLEELQRLT